MRKVSHFLFDSAAGWRSHIRSHHRSINVKDYAVGDHTLKQKIYDWIARDCAESSFYRHGRETVKVYDDGKMTTKVAADSNATSGSVQRYWTADTRYNTDVYNDIIGAVSAGIQSDAAPFSDSDSGDEDSDDFIVEDNVEEPSAEGHRTHLEISQMLDEHELAAARPALHDGSAAWDSDDMSDVEEVAETVGTPADLCRAIKRRTSKLPREENAERNFGYETDDDFLVPETDEEEDTQPQADDQGARKKRGKLRKKVVVVEDCESDGDISEQETLKPKRKLRRMSEH